MEWKQDKPKPVQVKESYSFGECMDPIRFSVSAADNGQTYCSFHMMLSEFQDGSPSECLQTWPVEAIARARKLLDELEESLSASEVGETSVNDAEPQKEE